MRGRKPKIDPQAVIAAFRDKKVERAADAAKLFSCSRAYMNQLLTQHAPELLPGKARTLTAADQKKLEQRRARLKKQTESAIRKHGTAQEAADALGLTKSGLQNRMRRYEIEASWQRV